MSAPTPGPPGPRPGPAQPDPPRVPGPATPAVAPAGDAASPAVPTLDPPRPGPPGDPDTELTAGVERLAAIDPAEADDVLAAGGSVHDALRGRLRDLSGE